MSADDGEYKGCDAEVVADLETGKSISRFYDPDTKGMVVELHLDPEVAREYAFNLTRSSIEIEEHQKRH